MASHGGARLGAGRRAKPLIDHVRNGTFNVGRHAHLLADDDSVIDAAAAADPDEYALQTLAEYCRIYREGNQAFLPGAQAMVAAFADGVRRF